MIRFKQAIAKKIWVLMFMCCSFSSVSYGARVFWNECVDMGGVDIEINSRKCMCVDGKLFDPRKQDSEFMCKGVGTKLYHIMLGQGQSYDREGAKGVNVVKKYKSLSKLRYQCTNLLNAECYNPKKMACVCKNNYHIDMTNFWPNTRDCYGTRFVSFGLGSNFGEGTPTSTLISMMQPESDHQLSLSDRFSKMDWASFPDEGFAVGRFDGILEIKDRTCGFTSGSDVDGIRCSTIAVDGLQYVSIDFSKTFDVEKPPSCIAQIIGPKGDIRVVDITNEKLVMSIKTDKRLVSNGVPEGCMKEGSSKAKETYTSLKTDTLKASVQCAFVD